MNQEVRINNLENPKSQAQISNEIPNSNDQNPNDKRIKELEARIVELERSLSSFSSGNSDDSVIPTGAEWNGGIPLEEDDLRQDNSTASGESSLEGSLAEFTPSDDGARDDNESMWMEFKDKIVTIYEEIIVTGKATFGKAVAFLDKVDFWGKVTFNEEAKFNDRVTYADRDMGGFAKIEKGEKETKVKFKKPYEKQPVVTLTPEGDAVLYKLEDVSKEGFKIKLADEAEKRIIFHWIALSIDIGAKPIVENDTIDGNNNNEDEEAPAAQNGNANINPETNGNSNISPVSNPPAENENSNTNNSSENGNINDNKIQPVLTNLTSDGTAVAP